MNRAILRFKANFCDCRFFQSGQLYRVEVKLQLAEIGYANNSKVLLRSTLFEDFSPN